MGAGLSCLTSIVDPAKLPFSWRRYNVSTKFKFERAQSTTPIMAQSGTHRQEMLHRMKSIFIVFVIEGDVNSASLDVVLMRFGAWQAPTAFGRQPDFFIVRSLGTNCVYLASLDPFLSFVNG
jgi:hypothetical protein